MDRRTNDEDAREILRGLELPPEAVSALLAHLETFCQSHGGERHYSELLALIRRLKSAQ